MLRRAALLVLPLVLAVASVAEGGPTRQCVDQSETLVGQRARLVDKDFAAPRRLTSNPFDYPTRAGTTKASGVWVGEALVDTAGKVRQVWTIRGFHFDPAWPEFDDAIATGIRSWTYEPATADGAAVPVCVTVSVNITWK
jgi:outer membrane biosynthesis protein TonB